MLGETSNREKMGLKQSPTKDQTMGKFFLTGRTRQKKTDTMPEYNSTDEKSKNSVMTITAEMLSRLVQFE